MRIFCCVSFGSKIFNYFPKREKFLINSAAQLLINECNPNVKRINFMLQQQRLAIINNSGNDPAYNIRWVV